MNPDDAFERVLSSLYEAALDDARWPAASALIEEACGAVGSTLWVGEGYGADERLFFARLLYRGEPRDDLAREYYEVYHPHDEGPPRHRGLPSGRLVHAPRLYTERELKTSVAYNEGWRRLRAQNALTVHLDLPDGKDDSWAFWGLGDPVGGDGWESARLRLAERLLPHIQWFVLIRQALAASDALGAGLAGLLDNDRIGVVQAGARRARGGGERGGARDPAPRRRVARPRRRPGRRIAGGPRPPAPAAGARAAGVVG